MLSFGALKDILDKQPRTLTELLRCDGMTTARARNSSFGAKILHVGGTRAEPCAHKTLLLLQTQALALQRAGSFVNANPKPKLDIISCVSALDSFVRYIYDFAAFNCIIVFHYLTGRGEGMRR